MAHKTSILEDGPDWLERKIQFIIEDGPKVLKASQGDPWKDPKKHEVFAPFGPKQVHPRGWTGFGWKTSEGVHREGGRGRYGTGSNTPTKVDGFWDGFGMVWG